ncbi:MAG TPA: hypothetical protein VHV76_08415 [Mycobacteriales bacterium]|jgi:hypothetical protein|nr:hypothetical protein [Mycobacteriales bacterium]
MRRRGWVAAATVAVVALAPLAPASAGGAHPAADSSVTSLCLPAAPAATPSPAIGLRFGVDPGLAGNPLPSLKGPVSVNHRAELKALHALQPHHRALVIRLNRLFWSGGNNLLNTFVHEAKSYARRGFDVEVQVRYHPTKTEDGDLAAWSSWVHHVVNVLGQVRRLVALTITNEVNLAISPNTSDGSYTSAQGALVHGVEAAYSALRKHGWAHRVKVGFTFAYRLDPLADSGLFSFLAKHGGARFLHALGFVGLDDYPGSVYPPTLVPPIDTAADELASALATMRDCYLPLAGIGPKTPLWVTENGYASNGSVSNTSGDATQVAALRGMVDTVETYSGTYDVTDYRWFNLRDNNSNGSGLFDKDGLLRDHDQRKPSFTAYRDLIKRDGQAIP